MEIVLEGTVQYNLKSASCLKMLSCCLQSWKHERVVAYYGSERVILIKPSDPKSWLNKVQNVLAIVDKELGYADSALEGLSNSQVLHAMFGLKIIL